MLRSWRFWTSSFWNYIYYSRPPQIPALPLRIGWPPWWPTGPSPWSDIVVSSRASERKRRRRSRTLRRRCHQTKVLWCTNKRWSRGQPSKRRGTPPATFASILAATAPAPSAFSYLTPIPRRREGKKRTRWKWKRQNRSWWERKFSRRTVECWAEPLPRYPERLDK